MIRAIVALAFALAADAQDRDPEAVLAKARDQILERADKLPNYTCVQTVDRTFFRRAQAVYPAPSCDLMSAERNWKAHTLQVEATDRLRLDVKVSGGNEIGSWAGASHFEEGDVERFVKGPFGTGPFGTFLSDIFSARSTQFSFVSAAPAGGSGLFEYRFVVPMEASHYWVQAGADRRVTGYDGVLEIDAASSELRRMTVRTAELPEETGACEADTSVDYAITRVGEREFLLPLQSELHFLMRDTTESDVLTAYSGCRQFVGEAKVSFGPAVGAGGSPVAATADLAVPAGLPVALELEEAIDTDKAAAGDLVAAKVMNGVRKVPAGSKVVCRIVRMEHWEDAPAHFLIALELETVEVKGHVSPFYAVLKKGEEEKALRKEASGLARRSRPILLRPRGQSELVGTFVFVDAGKSHVMPRGFEMKWTTVLAPQ